MIKLAAALAIALAASSATAQPKELNRCQTDNTFAYWTPDACANGDRNTASFVMRDTTRNFTEHVKRAECMWRAMTSDNKLYGPPQPGHPRTARPHPECEYPAQK